VFSAQVGGEVAMLKPSFENLYPPPLSWLIFKFMRAAAIDLLEIFSQQPASWIERCAGNCLHAHFHADFFLGFLWGEMH